MNKIESVTTVNYKNSTYIAVTDFIKDGMKVGLGNHFKIRKTIQDIRKRVIKGEHITIIPASNAVAELAQLYNIPVLPPANNLQVDISINGADEIDLTGSGIIGRQGTFLKEKFIAKRSDLNIWIANESKMTDTLGKVSVPIEISRKSYAFLLDRFREQNIHAALRMIVKNIPFTTENGNYIIDVPLNHRIYDPFALDAALKSMTGVIETGLFVNLVDKVLLETSYHELQIICFERGL